MRTQTRLKTLAAVINTIRCRCPCLVPLNKAELDGQINQGFGVYYHLIMEEMIK